MTRTIIISGALLAMLGVVLGAFGAHALKKSLSIEMLAVYKTAVDYHLIHALGLIMIGFCYHLFPSVNLFLISAITLFSGIVLFSGSLYALSLTSISWLGIITPIGGIFFIFGWLLFAIGIYKIQV